MVHFIVFLITGLGVYPNLGVTADYGDVGTTPDDSHGTFTFEAFAKFNISTAAESAATSFKPGRH